MGFSILFFCLKADHTQGLQLREANNLLDVNKLFSLIVSHWYTPPSTTSLPEICLADEDIYPIQRSVVVNWWYLHFNPFSLQREKIKAIKITLKQKSKISLGHTQRVCQQKWLICQNGLFMHRKSGTSFLHLTKWWVWKKKSNHTWALVCD